MCCACWKISRLCAAGTIVTLPGQFCRRFFAGTARLDKHILDTEKKQVSSPHMITLMRRVIAELFAPEQWYNPFEEYTKGVNADGS